jgi:undecaprenyl-diphosphatase
MFASAALPEWLAVILLAIIEGVTEFLPVSSTGHLLIVQNTGWLPRQSDLFNIVIQSGAVLAVLAAFSTKVRQLALTWREPATRDYLSKLAAAFGVTCIGGVLMKKFDVELAEEAGPVIWATLLGGVVILAVEGWLRGRPLNENVTWTIAIAVGLGQLFAAVFPGSSRSGTTILIALALGLNRPVATQFSYLVGIPTLLAAGALEIFLFLREPPPDQGVHWGMLILGTVVSAVTAFLVVKLLLRFVLSHTFIGFGWYRIALGILLLIVTYPGGS